ncbi:MAG: hypothetical protein KDD99_09345 [Bacteroidetes bacterium]|nr:hypothetical protein [Bacteroidota bacterium]
MTRHIILFLLIFYFLNSSQAQFDTPKIETADFNQDGFLDSLITISSPGSGFYYHSYTIIDGSGKLREEIIVDGCKCSLTNLTPIPEVLMKPENLAFRKALESKWNDSLQSPDHSLDWIIGGYFHPQKLADTSFFEEVFQTEEGWYKGEIQPPYNHSLIISGDTLNKLIDAFFIEELDEKRVGKLKSHKHAWLIYWGNTHRSWKSHPLQKDLPEMFTKADSSADYELIQTVHGVIVKKQNQYRWLLVSEIGLTSAPVRLSSHSIEEAKLVGDLVIINHISPHLGKPRVYIADILTGKVGNVQLDKLIAIPESTRLEIEINNNLLKVTIDGYNYEKETRTTDHKTFSLSELQKALNQ